MIQEFVDRFMANRSQVEANFSRVHPNNYSDIVRSVIRAIETEDGPDPDRIHSIDDGDYQGTLVFIIGAKSYQPDDYWYVKIAYGSCSGCDTLMSIYNYSNEAPTKSQIHDYMTLALHVCQGLKKME